MKMKRKKQSQVSYTPLIHRSPNLLFSRADVRRTSTLAATKSNDLPRSWNVFEVAALLHWVWRAIPNRRLVLLSVIEEAAAVGFPVRLYTLHD